MGTFCDKTETSDHKCSKKMEVDEGLNLNTVACLRGRLLAERHASRVAKEQAEAMGKKLVELEKLVKEEIKLRDKSERKLKLLRKKLESSSKSSKASQLGCSESSKKSKNSCGSSTISSNSKNSEANETRNCAKDSALTESLVANHNGSRSENGSSSTKDCESQITDNSSSSNYSEHGYSLKILSLDSNQSFEYESLKNDEISEAKDLKNDEIRLSSLSTKSSVTGNESDHADSFDNSLALVPVTENMTATSQASTNNKKVNESVFEALDALRVAKEKLQSSLGTRQIVQVGLN
ncbi:uncharacterized protein LOC131619767 isoform X2 [Vicia villosa]|uniref:uncharacterized protein LOC131619767 isoform X2 n=1 Tax=Vicia villosa TaxID=3911 RepID=UPI00273C68EE|nr:uncharacterized protein LOC131619767 isoform X2 [Vicia villosa]